MRGYRWLFAIAGLVGVSLVVFSTSDSGKSDEGAVTLVRRAAIQGLNDTAKRLVADSTGWSSNPDKYSFLNASLDGAQYSTKVVAPYREALVANGCAPDTVDVVATAELENGETHRIEATYVRTCDADMGIRLVNFAER